MKKILIAMLAVVMALGTVGGTAMAAPTGFTNPSFEIGPPLALPGWDIYVPPGGTAVSIMDMEGIYPVHGQRFALLKTDGPGSYTTLSQTFSVQAGDAISGWAFFKTNDAMPNFDNAQVQILQGSMVMATVFFGNTIGGTRPWTMWMYEFPASGTYTLRARIANGGNALNDSFMGLDLIVFKVAIDVKPGSDPNSINLNSKGVIPVAILTTPIFDVNTVDPTTVRFAEAKPVRQTLEDVDGDGDLDYLFHFRTEDLVVPEGQDYLELKAGTTSGYFIGGRDSINVVPLDN